MSEIIKMNNEELKFKDSDSTDKAILGTLEGPCADFIDSTRNGRKYSESLWEKVFEDPIVNELIENGGIPGELDHPTDREETDSSRIAVLLKEKPQKKDGKLWAKFSILNTPLGKIAYTLAKSGFKLGISSRGSGDTFTNDFGEEEVDESTYDFKAFDVVLVPAVKAARLNLVTESLKKKVSLKESFNKILNESTEEEKKLIEDAISKLNLDTEDDNISDSEIDLFIDSMKTESLEEDIDIVDTFDPLDDDTEDFSEENIVLNKDNENQLNAVDHIEVNENKEDGNTMSEMIKELQEAYNAKQELENKVLKLQEKLSVCYTKEAKIESESLELRKELNEMKQYASANQVLNEKVSTIQKQLDVTTNQLNRKNKENNNLSEKLTTIQKDNSDLIEQLNSNENSNKILKEDYDNIVNKLNQLTEDYNMKYTQLTEEYDSSVSILNEKIEKLEENLNINKTNFSNKLEKANSLVEKYKKIANRAVDRYISSQAIKLGVSENEIKNKLPESYTFNDIDSICENLQQYKLNVSRLPFRTDKLNENIQIKAKSSKKEAILPKSIFDDDIDSDLLRLAGL